MPQRLGVAAVAADALLLGLLDLRAAQVVLHLLAGRGFEQDAAVRGDERDAQIAVDIGRELGRVVDLFTPGGNEAGLVFQRRPCLLPEGYRRDSQTLGYETYYYAMLLPDGDILRVAQDSETIWSIYDAALPAIVLSCIVMMGAAAMMAGLLTRSLVQPILKMTDDLEHIQENVPYKELIPFAESIHSDRLLRENNEKMRQEFTANVSHELKTPLTSISGYAELIETGIAKSADVPEFGRKIHVEASRMIQLVNDILQLSHLDNVSETNDTPQMETVDLLDVAKECVERQKVNAQKSFISLTYLGESAPVLGSRSLLDELCQNLCDNAIRYNRPGGKVQLITACTRDGHCTLTVKDNGIGIPKEAQSSVFERFYRVDKSRSKATGGTGLGLAIVKHIARIHNARIRLESEINVGTTITVVFETAH